MCSNFKILLLVSCSKVLNVFTIIFLLRIRSDSFNINNSADNDFEQNEFD